MLNPLSRSTLVLTLIALAGLTSCGEKEQASTPPSPSPTTSASPAAEASPSPTASASPSASPSPKASATGEKSEATQQLEGAILPVLEKQLNTKADSLNCPAKFEFKAGSSINCEAAVQGSPFKVKVNFKDDQGNLNWEATGLLDLIKVEQQVESGFKEQTGREIKTDCGSKKQRYRSAVPGESFQCQATDNGKTKTVKATIKTEDGKFSWSMQK